MNKLCRLPQCWISCVGLLLLAAVALAHAWVADDAYVTFRVVDNAVHGYGLVWNTDERVQAYTHPLWMLLHLPFYSLFGHIYLTTTALSLACFLLAVKLTLKSSNRPLMDALCFMLPLALLQPIHDFAICGLENPLAMLMFSAFINTLWDSAGKPLREYPWYSLALFSSLLMLTRLDTIILIAPVWGWLSLRAWKDNSLFFCVRKSLPGWVPLIAWHLFSLFYYGFLYPNTKYAKLNTNIPEIELVQQGFNYLMNLYMRDTLAFAMLILMISGTAYGAALLLLRRTNAPALPILLGTGGALYMLYAIMVGGDFMLGRFFCLPLFLTCWLALRLAPADFVRSPLRIGAWAAMLLAGAWISNSSWQETRATLCASPEPRLCSFLGVIDERAYYLPFTGLFTSEQSRIRTEPDGEWVGEGIALRTHAPDNAALVRHIGLAGYYAGPSAKLVDQYALSEALLARLPMDKMDGWRIGHFKRTPPVGYLKARAQGDTSFMDPVLGEYYTRLREVISGDLSDLSRLGTIARFQTGQYDGLLTRYVGDHCELFYGPCPRKTGQKQP